MSSQVIALFEGRNYAMTIELTEEQKCVIIGSDYCCRKGYINQDERLIAAFHCRVYLQRSENLKSWNVFVQEKSMNTRKYVTYVNNNKLEMRKTQLLIDNDEIKIGSGRKIIVLHFVIYILEKKQRL